MSPRIELDSPQQKKNNTLFFWGIVGIAVIIGIYHAASLWYINDDCFVSFRYAKNFVNGLGLVYNAEERVEGYTNFLWTMLVALGLKLGIDPVPFSTTTGIICSLATIVLYGYLGWRLKPKSAGLMAIPLTALALSLHRDFNAHASSGMETSLFSFLINISFALLLLGRTNLPVIGAGFMLSLAMMTRPDGVIFLAASGVFILLTKKDWLKQGTLLMLAPIVVFLPYWLWRWSYFGFFFPNTFYAKSVDLSYWNQGLEYARLYFVTYYGFALLPLLGILYAVKQRTRYAGKKQPLVSTLFSALREQQPHPLLLATLFIVSYTLFVIKIGGDFMFARFFIAITPMILFSLEILIGSYSSSQTFRLALYAFVIITTLFRNNQYATDVFSGYVADEYQYFGKESYKVAQRQAGTLRKCFGEFPVRLAFGAGQLMLVYYLDPYYALEASGGLTDTAIAHQSVGERGRPGHEKSPRLPYLMKRKVEFYIGYVDPPKRGELALNVILFDSLLARTITYNDALMSKLAVMPEVKFVNIPQYLDMYIKNMITFDKRRVAAEYQYFKSFYFDHNSDTTRENAIIRFLNSP